MKIKLPDGTVEERLAEYWYDIPIEEQEYEYIVQTKEKELKFKIKIDQYEIVNDYDNGFKAYAVDIRNKRFLKINSAKVVPETEMVIDNKYLINEEEHNYLDTREYGNDMSSRIVTRAMAAPIYWTILECDEATVEGYAYY